MSEAIDAMIQAGHPWREIQTYTLPQIATFLRLYDGRKRGEHRELAYVVRNAYHADSKEFKKFLAQLEAD